jgi:hypothetical protein
MDKPFFVGQRSLRILEKLRRRQTLIGFRLPPSPAGQSARRPKECENITADIAETPFYAPRGERQRLPEPAQRKRFGCKGPGAGVVAWPRNSRFGSALTIWLDPSFAHYFRVTLLEVGRGVGVTVIGSNT